MRSRKDIILATVSKAILWAGTAVFVALLLNRTGDCAPDTENCGQVARYISFGILGAGALGIVLSILQGIRRSRGFGKNE